MKWIPLKESLPEANTIVLASFDNGTIDVLLQWWANGQDPVYADWKNELDEKCKRLAELNAELNMDRRENEIVDGADEQSEEEQEEKRKTRDDRDDR